MRRRSSHGPREGHGTAEAANRRDMPGHDVRGQGTGPHVAISSDATPRCQADGGRPSSGGFRGCIRVTKDVDGCVSRASRSID